MRASPNHNPCRAQAPSPASPWMPLPSERHFLQSENMFLLVGPPDSQAVDVCGHWFGQGRDSGTQEMKEVNYPFSLRIDQCEGQLLSAHKITHQPWMLLQESLSSGETTDVPAPGAPCDGKTWTHVQETQSEERQPGGCPPSWMVRIS